jgi:hypothetical protein
MIENDKSTSGYVFILGTSSVTWTKKKSHAIVLSSTKEEYQGAVKGACEAIWLKRMLSDMQMQQTVPTPMFCNKQGVLKLAKNERTKHVEMHCNFIKQRVEDRSIELQYYPTRTKL